MHLPITLLHQLLPGTSPFPGWQIPACGILRNKGLAHKRTQEPPMFPPPAIRNCREDSDTKPCDKRTLVSRKKADSLTAMYIVYRKVKTFPRDFSQAPPQFPPRKLPSLLCPPSCPLMIRYSLLLQLSQIFLQHSSLNFCQNALLYGIAFR